MERKKNWNDFQILVDARPDYRAWLHCKDPEEIALRKELLTLLTQLSRYAAFVQRRPMPSTLDDTSLSRSALHINQRISFEAFIETLFEHCLQQGNDETLNLLFAFLDHYIALLKCEHKWCEQQSIPPGE